MHLEDQLLITVGQATDAGAKPANEDCLGVRLPEEPGLTMKGIAAVIADGVSNAEAGREASESCVQSFLATIIRPRTRGRFALRCRRSSPPSIGGCTARGNVTSKLIEAMSALSAS
jgi:hypothetical protein